MPSIEQEIMSVNKTHSARVHHNGNSCALPFSSTTQTSTGSLRSNVTKAPLPHTDSNPRRLPKRTASLSRQRSLTEIAAETAATVIGPEQAAVLNNSSSQAVEFLSGKLSNALSFLTSNVPSQVPKHQIGNARGSFSSSNPNLAFTEISPSPFHRTLTKMTSNRISDPERESSKIELEFQRDSFTDFKGRSLIDQCMSPYPLSNTDNGAKNDENIYENKEKLSENPQSNSSIEAALMNGCSNEASIPNSSVDSDSMKSNNVDHFAKPNGQQSLHRMSESKRNSTIELKSENELLRREVERQKNQISTLEATLCELQSKNAKLEEIVVALQRSAVNHNGDNQSEQSLPISTPSNEANEDNVLSNSSEFPNKNNSPLSVSIGSNNSGNKQPPKLSPNGRTGYHHQKSFSDVQFYYPASAQVAAVSHPARIPSESEENYEAISHEYSSITHFDNSTNASEAIGRNPIANVFPRTPDANSRQAMRFGGSSSKITRTGSYSEKRHFTVNPSGSPMGTSLDCEENQYNSVPDLLEKSSLGDSLLSTNAPMSKTESKMTSRNMVRMLNNARNNGGSDGFSSDANPSLSDNSPIEFGDSPRPEQFMRGGATRSTAGPRMMLNPRGQMTSPMSPLANGGSDVPFKNWDSEKIGFWMAKMGLGKYASYINSHRVTGEKLAKMTPNEIEKNLRVKNSLHRKKLLLAVRAQLVGNWNDFVDMSTQWVARWLDDIGLPQYKDSFVEACVDGRVLHYFTFEDFAHVKVFSAIHQIGIGRAIQYLRIQGWVTDTFIRRSSHPGEGGTSLLHWSNHRVMEWLRSIDLSEYAPNLRGSGVHGALMCLEPRFTADTLADLLHIPVSKTLLRRHLIHHFDVLIGPNCKEHKRLIESSPYYQPLNIHYKVKPNKTRFKIPLTTSSSKSQNKSTVTVGSVDDLVCPLEFEVPSHIPSEVLPFGYVITSRDFSRSSPQMIPTPSSELN